jgi:hypothetical protein
MERVSFLDQCLIETGFVTDQRPDGLSLVELECKLLDLAAIPDLCSDVFYTLLYKTDENQCIARYFEAGSVAGFMRGTGKELLQELSGENFILPYRFDLSMWYLLHRIVA